jgi:manganese-dependent ADP-ribose/CDP-alcohol diphosphatase
MGCIADIQYADIPDGHSFGNPRYYRHALTVARTAAEHFERERAQCLINLGDIVDGKCQNVAAHGGDASVVEDAGMKAVDEVMEALSVYQSGPIFHAYGNHCLYNMDRPAMQSRLGIPFVKEPCGDLVGYSSHVLSNNNVRLVFLDSYDVAVQQRCPENSQKRKKAVELLRNNNPNYHENENSPEGLEGMARRYVAFNGAVGPIQLQWLRETLSAARERQERVIVLSHQPIHPDSSNPVCLMWNYEEVLHVLREYGDCIAASLAGHAHRGGHVRDEDSGIHFRVLEAALEGKPPATNYALVDLYHDKLTVRGYGMTQSATYPTDHLRQKAKKEIIGSVP